MGLYNAHCFLALALCSTIGTIFNIKCSLKHWIIWLARAVPLDSCFWRLHTAIEIPFKKPCLLLESPFKKFCICSWHRVLYSFKNYPTEEPTKKWSECLWMLHTKVIAVSVHVKCILYVTSLWLTVLLECIDFFKKDSCTSEIINGCAVSLFFLFYHSKWCI